MRDALRGALLSLAVTVLAPSTARAAHLWIAYEPGADTQRADYEDFFACLTGATNFNELISGYGGAAVYFAGDDVVGACGRNNFSCPVSMAQCVVDSAGFASMIQPGDTVLYVNTGQCGGWNDRRVSVMVGGGSMNIHFGEIGNGGTFRCQTWTGMHEVYEANTNGISGDCCSHETHFGGADHPECAAPTGEDPYGRYTLMGCAARTFSAQTLSPAGHGTDLAACTMLTVDTTSLCAQPRADRDRGVCMDGNVLRCSFGPTVEDCHGLGCSDAPEPHCNGASSGDAGADAAGDAAMVTPDAMPLEASVPDASIADASGADAGTRDAMSADAHDDASPDGGHVTMPAGCGCRAGASRANGSLGALAMAFVFAVGTARRRRRAQGSRPCR